jgi:hypothetical protein
MATIFAGDESGDIGLLTKRGTSEYLVFALVRFADAEISREEFNAFKKFYHMEARDLSFHEIQSQRLRDKVFKQLAEMPFQAWVLIVNKRILADPYRAFPPILLYAYLLSQAVSLIPIEQRANSNLILDEFDRSEKLVAEFTRMLRKREIERGFRKISLKRSSGEPLIQIADLIAGVTYHRMQTKDERLYHFVRGKIIQNVFPVQEKSPS